MTVSSLSPVQRLTLANQFRILALSEEEGTDTSDYTTKAEILLRGYTGLYDQVFSEVGEEQSPSVTEEVHQILTMFRAIHNSVAALPDTDKQQLDLQKLSFRGFDANNDDHYHQASFMLEQLDLYAEHQGNYINSHSSTTLPSYKRQLDVFNQIRVPMQNLDLAGLQAVAAAA
jgi:uncharacterized protein YfbU (UPF0304 family)